MVLVILQFSSGKVIFIVRFTLYVLRFTFTIHALRFTVFSIFLTIPRDESYIT